MRDSFAVGSLDFDPRSGEIRTQAQVRRLEPRAAAVLRVLCEHEGAVVTRQELLDRCWGEGEGSDEALTQAIAQIRRALDELGEPGLVETLAKRGYRLKPSPAAQPAVAPPFAPRTRMWRWAIPGVVAAALLLLATAGPHATRHWVRHALGLGPNAQSGH